MDGMVCAKENIIKVSIIICHHTGDLIKRCLASIPMVPEYEVIVVTTDDMYKKTTERLCIRLCAEMNNPALKRNIGAQYASGQYLVYLDDDTEMDVETIDAMYDYMWFHRNAGMVFPVLYKMDDHDKIDTSGSYLTWSGFLYETYCGSLPWPAEVISSKSAVCMVRKDLFDMVGGFDPSFYIYGEETDLSWRLWRAGYANVVLPWVSAYHAFETSLKPKSYYNNRYIHFHGCKNYITMLLRNLPPSKLYIAFLNAGVWLFTGICMWPRNHQAAKWIFQGIWYNIKNFPAVIRYRRQQKNYWIPRVVWHNPGMGYYFGRLKDYLTHQLHG